jgi:uncharacterized protein (UPF0276 family)
MVEEGLLKRPILADSHSHPVPTETLHLLQYVLVRHTPATIILERDERLDAVEEILEDVVRIRKCVANNPLRRRHGEAVIG